MDKILEKQMLLEVEEDLNAVFHRFGRAVDRIVMHDIEPTPRMAYLMDYIDSVRQKYQLYVSNKT